MLQHRPGNGHAIEGGGAPANFVQDEKAPGCGMLQNLGHLRHLHHKGGLTRGQVIAGANAGENPVHNANPGRFGRDEGAHLGQNHHKGHLPHIGGLSRHVGARDDGHLGARHAQLRIVGHKQAVLQHLLHHRVAALPDEDLGACGHLRPAVAPLGSHSGQGAQHIHGSHRRRSLLDPPGPLGDELPEAGEQLVFQGSDSVLCREHCGLQLLQLLGDVPLTVGQSLLSDVMRRHLGLEGLGHLDVIAEDPVIAHLQGADAGLLPLLALYGGNGPGSAIHNVPQAVNLLIGPLPDEASLPDGKGRVGHDGLFNEAPEVLHLVQIVPKTGQHGALQPPQLLLQLRQGPAALGQAHKIPAIGGAGDNPGHNPLQV